MSFKHSIIALAAGSALVLFGAPAFSQTGQSGATAKTTISDPASKLAGEYSTLAGSDKNADALVAGLRDGTTVTLSATSPTAPAASFTPATGKLGYGNINIALSLAKADLAKQGITNPTPAQLAAALNGGLVTTATGPVTMAGVLAQRQAGLGWGQIANAMGVTLGSLVSASKTDKAGAKTERAAKEDVSGKSGDAHGNSGKGNAGGNGGGGGNSGGGNGGGNSGGGGGHK